MKGRIVVPLACIFLVATALPLVGISREMKTPRRQLMQLDPKTVKPKRGVMTETTPVSTANTAVHHLTKQRENLSNHATAKNNAEVLQDPSNPSAATEFPTRSKFNTPENPIHHDAMLIVPYRNRAAHRDKLLAHFGNCTSTCFNDKKFLILISEEDDRKHFSRSWLFNVGFITAMNKHGINQGCVIPHDIDELPKACVPCTTCDSPTQLNSEDDQHVGKPPCPEHTGGVISMSVKHWLMVNGLGNAHRGWGKEDDDLGAHIKLNKLQGKLGVINRPSKGQGSFSSHGSHGGRRDKDHTKIDKSQVEKNLFLWKLMRFHIIKRNTTDNDGISSANHVMTKSVRLSQCPNVDAEQMSFQLPEEEAKLLEDLPVSWELN